MENETKRTIITADGKEIPEEAVEVLRIILGCFTDNFLKMFGVYELIDTLAVNLVKSNTKEDLDRYWAYKNAIFDAKKIMEEKENAKKKETVAEETQDHNSR